MHTNESARVSILVTACFTYVQLWLSFRWRATFLALHLDLSLNPMRCFPSALGHPPVDTTLVLENSEQGPHTKTETQDFFNFGYSYGFGIFSFVHILYRLVKKVQPRWRDRLLTSTTNPTCLFATSRRWRIRKVMVMGGCIAVAIFWLVIRRHHQESGEYLRNISSIELCPYAIQSEEEAHLRAANVLMPGNIVTVEHLRFCRTGNRFHTVIQNLALGYCCKSKLVSLPPKDDILAPGIFNEGTPGPLWFDFSNAPNVKGFESLSCKANITWAGQRAFRMDQLDTPDHPHYTPMLRECIKSAPRLLGCESAYYFPADFDVCRSKESKGRRQEANDEDHGESHDKGAGTLVLHVRSGDIFDNDVLNYYGQPPLQFYLYVIQHKKWDRIEVVTNGEDTRSLNPVIPALQAKIDSGELPENIQIHTNRSMGEDFKAMMCADALGMAKSTIGALNTYHTTASRIYGPFECTARLRRLAKFRPKAQVYGLSGLKKYSVYENWENTPYQRKEMVEYSGIRGLQRCKG